MRNAIHPNRNLLFRNGTAARRCGMTLVELLVVAGLLVVLISISIPMLNPVAEGRQAREAVRGIQAALDTAKARAMRLGRPCGVALPPFVSGAGTKYPVCIQVEQVTAPPNVTTTCNVTANGPSNFVWQPYALKKGDRVQINQTGPWLQYSGTSWLRDAGNGNSFELYQRNQVPCTLSYSPVSESGNPFAKVLGLDTSFGIPRGVVVDLRYSGCGDAGTLGDTYGTQENPAMIIFHPDGTARLNVGGSDKTTDSKIYLLVGNWDLGLGLGEGGVRTKNYDLPTSFWIVIHTDTGLVLTARNKADGKEGNTVTEGRTWAKDPDSAMGGR